MTNWYAGTGYRQDVEQEFGPFNTREEAEDVVRDILRKRWIQSYQTALGSAKIHVWNIVYEPMPEYTWDEEANRWNPNIPWYTWGPNPITSQGPGRWNPNWKAIRWRQNAPTEMFLQLNISREDWLSYENELLNSWFVSDYEIVCRGSLCKEMTDDDWEIFEATNGYLIGLLSGYALDMNPAEYQSASREEILSRVTVKYSRKIEEFNSLLRSAYGADISLSLASIEISLGLEVPLQVRKLLNKSIITRIEDRSGRKVSSFDWELVSEDEYALENPLHSYHDIRRQTYLSYLTETGYKSSPSWDPLEQHELAIQSGVEYLDYMGYAPCAGLDAIYYTMPSLGNYPEFIRWED